MSEKKISLSSFSFSLASAQKGKGIHGNEFRIRQTNLIPLKILISKKHGRHNEKYPFVKPNEKALPEHTCYLQIWEMDAWKRVDKKNRKKLKIQSRFYLGAEAEKGAKNSNNELLAEFNGYIKQEDKKRFTFIKVAKEYRSSKEPFAIGDITVQVTNESKNIEMVTIPIRGESEKIIDLSIVCCKIPERDYEIFTDTINVFHFYNMSKIIHEQLQTGGLRVMFYTDYLTKAQWKNTKYLGDKWFKDGSSIMAREHKSIAIDENGNLFIGSNKITDKKHIHECTEKIVTEVEKICKERPVKIRNLGIWCHGLFQKLKTGGYEGPGKRGMDVKLSEIPSFVKGFKRNGKTFLADDILIGLFACLTGRSSFMQKDGRAAILKPWQLFVAKLSEETDKKVIPEKSDSSYGLLHPNTPTIEPLGKDSFAYYLQQEFINQGYKRSVVSSHTTAGTADGNFHIRYFFTKKDSTQTLCVDSIDLINLLYYKDYMKAQTNSLYSWRYIRLGDWSKPQHLGSNPSRKNKSEWGRNWLNQKGKNHNWKKYKRISNWHSYKASLKRNKILALLRSLMYYHPKELIDRFLNGKDPEKNDIFYRLCKDLYHIK